ncbi:MAG TPA: hypothetical protein VN453_05775 [Feifaniaceae bacterium]|nr:hypothetical protein [Feifaniaceae bacterium]
MDDDRIFRKVAVERLSSPENLDQVMRVVPAKGWIALACLFVFAAAAFAWACFGEIAQQVETQGILTQQPDGTAGEVIATLSAEDSRGMQPDNEAFIALDSGEILSGTVVSVTSADGAAESTATIRLNSGEAEQALKILAGTSAQIFENATGWRCTVRITIQTLHPIQMMLPG